MLKTLFSISFFSLLLSIPSFHGQSYFQQEVNYTIEVRLDDKNHFLHGFEKFVYHNNSKDTMSVLFIHLWPNAYKNSKSALARQQMRGGDFFLLYAGQSDRGFIDSLHFKVDGIDATHKPHEGFEDIAIIELPKSLQPGESITVTTPFRVKLPSGTISRLGHIGESYQITQWYPKPAVYDLNGWHEMPYLNQGEFYSEFGSFDVKITLPENYTVGATGDLQTTSEIQRLDSLAKLPLNVKPFINELGEAYYPPSSTKMKTLHYVQSNVHDFGWFADKTWNVRKGETTLPHSKRKVTTWAMFTPEEAVLWDKGALKAINDGLYYYSLWSGDYPYNQCTAVDGTISAGGGMEYPNVTVIGRSGSASGLATVIIHEVGHNWFYGILASNERDNAWMDEGLNSFFETRTILATNPNMPKLGITAGNKNIERMLQLDDLSYQYVTEELAYLLTARNYADQPMQLPSDYYSNINYGAIVYKKTALAFNYLMNYLGEDMMNQCMSAYYEEWKFRHPEPENLQAVFEKTSGKNLDWFFDRLINTKERVDYKVRGTRFQGNGKSNEPMEVHVKNSGEIAGPFSIDVYRDGKFISRKWFDGIEPLSSQRVTVNALKGDVIKINNTFGIPEYKRSNNLSRTKGVFRKIEPLQLSFLSGVDHPEKSRLFWAPLTGWNNYNKWMLGLVLHNTTLPKQDFSWRIAPLYSPSTNWLNGYAMLEKDNGQIAFGARTQRFASGIQQTPTSSQIYGYRLWSPYIKINVFPRRFKKDWTGYFKAEWIFLRGKLQKETNDIELHDFALYYTEPRNEGEMNIVRFTFNTEKKMVRSSLNLKSDLQSGEFNSWGLMWQNEMTFDYIYRGKGKRHWTTRAYFGLTNGEVKLSAAGQNGTNDYLFDGHMMGRQETSGLLSRQYLNTQGGLFLPSGSFLYSNDGLFSIRTAIDAPIRLPVNIYAGMALDGEFNYIGTAGIGLPIVRNIFEIYLPLVHMDENGVKSLTDGVYFRDLIGFQLNLDLANPFNLVKKIQ
jgi:hypothetical protein